MLSSPRPSPPPCSVSLPPSSRVGWGGVRTWVPPDHGFGTLLFSLRSAGFPRCRQSAAAFFPVALSGFDVFAIFSYYMWFLEEVSVSPLTLPSLILLLQKTFILIDRVSILTEAFSIPISYLPGLFGTPLNLLSGQMAENSGMCSPMSSGMFMFKELLNLPKSFILNTFLC